MQTVGIRAVIADCRLSIVAVRVAGKRGVPSHWGVRGLGLREWVALGVLGIGVLFAFLFFDPTSTDGSNDAPGTISLGGTPPTATPTAEPTATPLPVTKLAEPQGGWLIFYYEEAASGREVRTGEGFLDRLELDVPGRPFPDVDDDAWRFEASQQLTLEAGRYRFELETDGAVRVLAGEAQLLDEKDANSVQRRTVQFDHAGGQLTLTISVDDTGGPVRLRWAN